MVESHVKHQKLMTDFFHILDRHIICILIARVQPQISCLPFHSFSLVLLYHSVLCSHDIQLTGIITAIFVTKIGSGTHRATQNSFGEGGC
jgi:hypothetical protein